MATTSFADYMARVSASMIHAALANAAEKAAAAAAHHQQQNRVTGAGGVASTACASPSLVPFFPLPLLALPSVTGQVQQQQQQMQQNGKMAKGAENAKMGEQRQQQNLGSNNRKTTTTTTPKANRNAGGERATTATAFSNSGDKDGAERQQSDGDTQQRQPNKPLNDGPKRRKRPCPSTPTTEEPPKQQQQLLVKAEHQSSESPLSASRISSPDSVHRSGNGRGARKLKLYVAEEKVDIIDYAKCIGNRAAGREFNVAESSIREWRKNEEKIRRQAESTLGCTQHFEQSQPDILAWIDDTLVKTMTGDKGEQCTATDWYAIAAKARQLWTEKAQSNDQLDGSEMKITMGWVSRFMRRNENRVPKIAPPIIATGNATSSNGAASFCSASSNASGTTRGAGSSAAGGLSMVKSNPLAMDTLETKQEETKTKVTRPKRTNRATAGATASVEGRPQQKKVKMATTPNGSGKTNGATHPRGTRGTPKNDDSDKISLPSSPTTSANAVAVHNQQQQTNAVPTTSSRRRKCLKPMRVDATCATLLTTSSPTTDNDQQKE